MPVNDFHRIAAVLVTTAGLLAPGCASTPTPDLSLAEQVAASCPTSGARVAALIASDESGSRRGLTAQPAQQQVIREVVERAAVCGGHLRVALFAGSTVGVPVFDGDLKLDGATQNARLRKASKLVDDVMGQIDSALPGAQEHLPDGATDIVGQLQPGVEYLSQLATAGTFQLDETILTDGIQTTGADLADLSLTAPRAAELATAFTVPDLTGSQLRLIGIGRQSDGSLLPTPYVEALKAFHTAVCQRTKATCTVVTDAAGR